MCGSKIGKGFSENKELWEKQYSGSTWDFLYQEEEKEHYQALVELCRKWKPAASILDVGCGEGVLYSYLLNAGYHDYQGVEISEAAVRTANSKFEGKRFVAASAENYSPNNMFDFIIFNESIYYFSNPIKVLNRYQQFLNPSGMFVVSMCEYVGNRAIRNKISKTYEVHDQIVVRNHSGQVWNIELISI